MVIPEKIFLDECKKRIEAKLNWAESSEWKQRDFQNLSELIFESTGVLLSLSTLKRIWKNNTDSIPHPGTLNALAQFLGYKNWVTFKQEIAEELNGSNSETAQENFSEQTIHYSETKPIFKRPVVWVATVIVVGVLITIFSVTFHVEENLSEVEFSSKTVVTFGVPNTVVFNYDISKVSFDSAFIQQSWNPKNKIPIRKDNNQLSSIYFFPGLHKAKLIIDDNIAKQHNLLIKTDGWIGIARYSLDDEIPIYIHNDNMIKDGRIYISPEDLTADKVNIKDNDYLVTFYNVGGFEKADGDNFIFETKVKNNLSDGGLTCQYMLAILMCENGRIIIPLSMAGCVANIYVKFIEKWVLGRQSDLSMFGCDMNNWNELKCVNDNKNVIIELNGKEIYKLQYNESAGRIIGLCYTFYGCGSIDDVRLSSIEPQP